MSPVSHEYVPAMKFERRQALFAVLAMICELMPAAILGVASLIGTRSEPSNVEKRRKVGCTWYPQRSREVVNAQVLPVSRIRSLHQPGAIFNLPACPSTSVTMCVSSCRWLWPNLAGVLASPRRERQNTSLASIRWMGSRLGT